MSWTDAEIEALARRAGVADLTPEELARLKLQAEGMEAVLARLPRWHDKTIEPAVILAVPLR